MQWESMGFKDEPFRTQPITAYSIALYSGNEEKIEQAKFAFNSKNIVTVIEGDRGLGTTSFGNYIRFSLQEQKKYFTPVSEIRVEPTWHADTLLAATIANIVSSLELSHFAEVKNLKHFKHAKSLIHQVTDIYHSYGATAFGIGGSFGSSAKQSQPMLMPTQILAEHLQNLVHIVNKLGYQYGLLIQLNNLDVGVVQKADHLAMLLNVMRDYLQTTGTSWLLVGDTCLRRFIAQHVDRVDDIISFETRIDPLNKDEYLKLIEKRVHYFRASKTVTLPVEEEVLLYLYHITKGRLRYIFGLLNRLFNQLQVGSLTSTLSLDLAKPAIHNYAKERVQRFHLTPTEERVLVIIATNSGMTVGDIAEKLQKSPSQISNTLNQLQQYNLVNYVKEWRNHHYYPSIDAQIAYS